MSMFPREVKDSTRVVSFVNLKFLGLLSLSLAIMEMEFLA